MAFRWCDGLLRGWHNTEFLMLVLLILVGVFGIGGFWVCVNLCGMVVV